MEDLVRDHGSQAKVNEFPAGSVAPPSRGSPHGERALHPRNAPVTAATARRWESNPPLPAVSWHCEARVGPLLTG